MRPTPTFYEAMLDPAIFGNTFAGPSWEAHRVIARATDGLPLDRHEREIFAQLAGSREPPTAPVGEFWLVKGRRAGGSLVASARAVHTAAFGHFEARLAPGEIATITLLCADRRQSRTLLRYCTGLIDASPLLSPLVEARTSEAITLRTRCTIEIHTSSFRSVRGYALALAIADELAYWVDAEGGSNPSEEVLVALRPALASLGGRLVCLSSPHARRGPLWETFSKKFGQDDPRVLVVQGRTELLNPTIDRGIIERALEEDEAAARAEWLAEFRRDIEALLSREAVDAATISGRFELPPARGVRYEAFVDPSGGSSDSMTLAIAHRASDGRIVLDCLREHRPPFSPEAVAAEDASVIRSYGQATATGDHFGGEWPREQFRKYGVEYRVSDKSKSAIYQAALPLINSGRVELLDLPRLSAQLLGLERRVARGGKDSIDHGPGGHDDCANSALGAIVLASAVPAELMVLNLYTGKIENAREHAARCEAAARGLPPYDIMARPENCAQEAGYDSPLCGN